MKTTLKLRVEQVQEAIHYKGYIEIARHSFEYELKCTISLEEIDCAGAIGCVQEYCCFFDLDIKKGGVDIHLEREEYILFLQMIVPFVIGFYNSPKIRQINLPTRYTPDLIAVTGGELAFDFPDQFCGLLNAPKFDCRISA